MQKHSFSRNNNNATGSGISLMRGGHVVRDHSNATVRFEDRLVIGRIRSRRLYPNKAATHVRYKFFGLVPNASGGRTEVHKSFTWARGAAVPQELEQLCASVGLNIHFTGALLDKSAVEKIKNEPLTSPA